MSTSTLPGCREFLIPILVPLGILLIGARERLMADDEAIVPTTQVTGTVVDQEGNGVSGVTVEAWAFRDTRNTRTDERGEFRIDVPTARLRGLPLIARADDDRLMSFHRVPWETKEGAPIDPVELILQPPKSVTVVVHDADGVPIGDAEVGVQADFVPWSNVRTDEEGQAIVILPATMQVHAVCAWKDGEGADYRGLFSAIKEHQGQKPEPVDLTQPISLTLDGAREIRLTVLDELTNELLEGVRVYPWLLKKPEEDDSLNLSYFGDQVSSLTDADGQVSFSWIPTWHQHPSMTLWADFEGYVHQRVTYEIDREEPMTVPLAKLVPVRGTVVDPDGKSVAGLQIQAVGGGHQIDRFRKNANTDDEGRFELMVAPHMLYLLVVDDEKWAAPAIDGLVVKAGEPIEGLTFELRPATRLFGQVTVGPENKPVEGQQMYSYQYGKGLHELEDVELPNPDGQNHAVQPNYVRHMTTDEHGRFEFFVGPGNYSLRGPKQVEIEKFDVTDEASLEFNFNSPREETGPLRGRIVTGDPPRPVPHAKIWGVYGHQRAGRDLDMTADEQGTFSAIRERHPTTLQAQSADGTLKGIVEIGPDEENVTISVSPSVTVRGRVIEEETGEPLAEGREIIGRVSVSLGDGLSTPSFGSKTTVDDYGIFRLEGLAVGGDFTISVTGLDGRSWSRVATVTPDSSEEIDLGDLYLEKPYRPPTMAERIERLFERDSSYEDRLTDALEDARLGRMRILLVFADPAADATQQLYELRLENRDVRNALENYRVISVSTAADVVARALGFARDWKLKIDDLLDPRLLIVDADRVRLADLGTDDLSVDGAVDADKFIGFLNEHALPPLDARELLDAALAQAKRENKRVFVQETATWCGPCKRLSQFLREQESLFSKDYLHVKLDHRWLHCEEVLESFQDESAGIPWSVILDADGQPLITSDGPDGNIGYPSTEAEIDHFLKMIRETAIRLSEDDLRVFESALR